MATFVTHPLFGLGAAYAVSEPRRETRKFILLSVFCQWVPDADTISYLFPINETHPLGHRGLTHSAVFALLLAGAVVRVAYPRMRAGTAPWWGLLAWFFVITALHGVFDAMVDGRLGVAFFWPIDNTRFLLPWRPFFDVPIKASVLYGDVFWRAVLVECEVLSMVLIGPFVYGRMRQRPRRRPRMPVSGVPRLRQAA